MPAFSQTHRSENRPKRTGGKRLVVRGLLAGLLKGEWQGGARLTEAEAVARFGVSRTPVREAFSNCRGSVRGTAPELRGPSSCPSVRTNFGRFYAVRTLLEVEAARLAAGRIPEGTLNGLLSIFTQLRETGGFDPDWEHDRNLHRVIAEASGNRRLLAEISRYGDVIQTVREIVGEQDYGIHETTADEHLLDTRSPRQS